MVRHLDKLTHRIFQEFVFASELTSTASLVLFVWLNEELDFQRRSLLNQETGVRLSLSVVMIFLPVLIRQCKHASIVVHVPVLYAPKFCFSALCPSYILNRELNRCCTLSPGLSCPKHSIFGVLFYSVPCSLTSPIQMCHFRHFLSSCSNKSDRRKYHYHKCRRLRCHHHMFLNQRCSHRLYDREFHFCILAYYPVISLSQMKK